MKLIDNCKQHCYLKKLVLKSKRKLSKILESITIQSGLDTLEDSRPVMILLIVSGFTEIFNFKLVVEGKASRELPESIRLHYSDKIPANNFCHIYRKKGLRTMI